jgi:hypothetical protein
LKRYPHVWFVLRTWGLEPAKLGMYSTYWGKFDLESGVTDPAEAKFLKIPRLIWSQKGHVEPDWTAMDRKHQFKVVPPQL